MFALPDPGPALLVLPDEAATAALARRLAAAVETGDVIALHGALGVGKTSFARAFIQALAGADEEVPSPTFTLAESYDLPGGIIWHFDLYRLDDPAEITELGFEEALAGLAVLIEWPDRLGRRLPMRRLDVTLSQARAVGSRLVRLTPQGGSSLLSRAGLGAYA